MSAADKAVFVNTLANIKDNSGNPVYSQAQIAGIAGNAKIESNWNPTATNTNEGAFGLLQWRGTRLDQLNSFAASQGLDPNNPATQALFTDAQLRGSYGPQYQDSQAVNGGFFGTTTAADAASNFDKTFERSDGSAQAQRIAAAEDYNQGNNLTDPNYTGNGGTAGSGTAGIDPAAGAGGKGGGAGCASAGFAGLLSIAAAGIFGGFGIGSVFEVPILGPALNSVDVALGGSLTSLSEAMGSIGGIGTLAQAGIALATGNPATALATLGAGIAPGLGGVIPAAMAIANGNISPSSILQLGGGLVGGSLGSAMVQLGGIAGVVQAVAANMSGQGFSGGNLGNFTQNMYSAQAATFQSRQLVTSTADALSTVFGNGPNGLGASIQNNDNLVTYGVSSISNNLPLLGSDMVAAGTWDTRNPSRLMQPGNIAAQIVSQGLAGPETGLLTLLIANNIPIGSIDNPIYDAKVLAILAQINSATAIDAIRNQWKCQIELDNLGQLADMKTMLPNAYPTMTVSTWQDLGLKLIDLQITNSTTLDQIGTTLWSVERIMDLNHVAQMTTPFDQPSAESIMKAFGYGSGTYGELTMADFIGTAAGYVHGDTFPVIIDNIKYLETRSEATQYFDGTTFMLHFAQGKYTTESTSGGGDGGGDTTTTYTYTVPKNEPGYTDGFIGIFTDSAVNTPIEGHSGEYTQGTPTTTGRDAAVLAIKAYIEEGMTTLVNSTDPAITASVDLINKAHAASVAQLFREAHLLNLYDINLFETTPNTPSNAFAFIYSAANQADQTGYGQIADYIERVATNNIYGDAIKATLRMSRNIKLLQPLGVNPDRFNLPISQYYRDPLSLTKSLYDGLVPPQAAYNTPVSYPVSVVDQYITQRDAKLIDAGMSQYMTADQKDESYVDVYWEGIPQYILTQMGQYAVQGAINRNVRIIGNDLMIVDMNGNLVKIATITSTGLTTLDMDSFISIMFDITNRILYGNILVSKNTNQFLTDQIIYAVAELFSQINSLNINEFLNTVLGQGVVADLLQKLATKFANANTVFDTSMDRNEYGAAYGGSGPGVDPGQIK
jgi:Phage tail lysozyme